MGDDSEPRADTLKCSCLSKAQKRRQLLLCCTSTKVRACPIHKDIPRKIRSHGKSYAVEEADSLNEGLMTVDSETTDTTILETADTTILETADTTILETADTTIFEQRDTTTFDTLHGDDHIEVIETNKTIAADLTSTNSRLNSELSFIDIWDAALTNVYGDEKRDAGSKDEQETLSRKLDSESVGTTADGNEPTVSLQNQSDQHTSGKVIETKSHTDCKENEPSALTGATYIDEQIKQRHASSTENSECERDKPTAASADNRSSGDVVPREKADREVRLIQSLKELCSVVFAKNGKVKKAKSDVQQKELNQKGAYDRPKELENDSGIAISDLNQDSGREINKEITNNPDSLGEHASQREGIQYNVEMKGSSTEELVLLKRLLTEEVDKKRIRDNAGSPNKDNRSNTDTGDEKDVRTSSSKGTKDYLSGDDSSSDTHFLIQISNSDDDIDCDLDINDAYDMYMVHEAERNRSVNEEGTCHMINNAQQDILNREETGVNASNSQRNTDTVTDNCLNNDTKEVKDTVNANVQNTIHEIHAPKKVMTGPSDILRHEAKQINNIKKQTNDLKQNLKEKPSSTVDEVNQTSVKHISADLAEDIVKHVAYLEKGGTDTLEHMVPKKMTANLVVPLPFRSQFLLDNCSVKTFKTHPKDKSKLTVELEIDYRIDTAKYNKDQKQQQSSGEIYTNGVIMKQTDIETLHFGLGARPKLATNMHQHLNQHDTAFEDIEGAQQRQIQGSPSGYRRHKKKTKRKPRLPSPPKLRRMLTVPGQIARPSVPSGFVMPNVTNITSPAPFTWTPSRPEVDDFDSQVVDRAMSNLPSVLSQVFTIQKGQTNDIHGLQQVVTETKAKIAEVEEKRDDIRQEISSMTRKIYMAEEDIKENGKTCKLLKSDIENLVIMSYERQRDVSFKEEDVENEIRKLHHHKVKKAKFANEVAEYETKTSEIQKKMNDVNTKLAALREQKTVLEKDKAETERIVKGIVAREIQSDNESLKQKLEETGLKAKAQEEQLRREREKQNQINQTMQVLQKKNAAQMTRLRRQLKDVQLQNKQWTNQISNLELKITQLRSEVDID